MVFSSLTFLFFFFPVVCVLYFLCKNRVYRNVVLLIASLVFYSWGEPKYILLMLAATLAAYLGGLLIDHWRTSPRRAKAACIVTSLLLVANLFVFKYLNFVVENLNLLGLPVKLQQITLPIGISFYTFQILSYVIDLYRGQVRLQKNFFYLALYVCFFPQLIAGPIVRYQTVEHEIRGRQETLDDIDAGLRRFIIGLAKKVILANNIAVISETIYAADPAVFGSAMYWIAALCYALQIYFDFSGYSDMAIGIGRIFGFHFLENFRDPYAACSITDFWRRWHISLSSWFRDYIYIPLGGNRVSKGRWIRNILVVWGLTGFWHGAQWNFLLWGLYYAALLLLEKLLLHKWLEKLPRFFQWLYAMILVLVGWVMFNLTDFSQMLDALAMMFTFQATDWIGVIAADTSLLYGLIYLPLGILCCLPQWRRIRLDRSAGAQMVSRLAHLALLALCVIFLLSSTYNPFIYFRF